MSSCALETTSALRATTASVKKTVTDGVKAISADERDNRELPATPTRR